LLKLLEVFFELVWVAAILLGLFEVLVVDLELCLEIFVLVVELFEVFVKELVIDFDFDEEFGEVGAFL